MLTGGVGTGSPATVTRRYIPAQAVAPLIITGPPGCSHLSVCRSVQCCLEKILCKAENLLLSFDDLFSYGELWWRRCKFLKSWEVLIIYINHHRQLNHGRLSHMEQRYCGGTENSILLFGEDGQDFVTHPEPSQLLTSKCHTMLNRKKIFVLWTRFLGTVKTVDSFRFSLS